MLYRSKTNSLVSRNNDYYVAGKILWFLFNIILSAFIALIYLNEKLVSTTSNWLKENHTDTIPCFFCGMTRALIEITKGHWQEAYILNTNSIVFASCLIINLLLFLITFKTLITNR